MRSAFWGSLDLEQKSSADEREAYKSTTSEDVAIEKERKNEEIRRISTLGVENTKKIRAKMSVFDTFALFRLCLKEAAPFDVFTV